MGRTNNYMKICVVIAAVFLTFLLVPRALMAFAEEEEENQTDDRQLIPTRISYTEPDGKNGWYLTAPDIKIIHKEPEAVTKFRILLPSGKAEEGELRIEKQEDLPEEQSGLMEEQSHREEEKKKDLQEEDREQEKLSAVHVIPGEVFEEGKSILEVWMILPEDGQEIFRIRKEIMVDLEPPVEMEIQIPPYPDGNSSFFHSEVGVVIKCQDHISGVDSIYVCMEGKRIQRIVGNQGIIIVPPGYQGKISAYAVDCSGRKSEICISGVVLCEDDAPSAEIRIAGGADGWQQNSVEVEVCVKDGEEAYGFSSGLRSVTCYAGEQIKAKRIWEYEGEQVLSETLRFQVTQASVGGSAVPVTVHVSDRAGNTSVMTEKLYLDFYSPEVKISGVRNGMIAGEGRKGQFILKDENILTDCSLKVSWTRIDGTTETVMKNAPEDWRGSPGEKRAEVDFSEDGKYVCTVTGTDASGRCTEKTISFIIDRTDPVIRYVEQLNGAYIPFFQWNYGKEMVQDLTDYSCRMYLNSREYVAGTRVMAEGKYLLEVRAWDQAGNEASAEAIFTIDRTAPAIYWGELKDGSVYEEGVLLTVWVEGQGERLSGLYINGEKQKLDYESRIFQYEILQSGNYSVTVRAEDQAGNDSEESIEFRVKERTSFLPVLFRTAEIFAGKSLPDGAEGKEIFLFFLSVSAAAGIIGICMRRISRYVSRKKKP